MPACNAETLCAVMSDYYETLEPESGKPTKEEPKEQSKEQSMICNESLQIPKPFGFLTESSFTKNSGFFEQQKSLVIQPHQSNPIKIPAARFNASPERKIPMKLEQSFETPQRFKRKIANTTQPINQAESLRGMTAMDPYQVIMSDVNVDCDREQQIISSKVKKWVKYEYFYSGIDKPYFEKSEFQECMDSLQIPYKTLKRADYILIRKAIGRPRRLSQKFLSEERERLKKYREVVREVIPYIVNLFIS